MTQEEVADKATVALRTIRGIETGRIGRPRQGTVRLLAAAFGLDGGDRDRFQAAAQSESIPAAVALDARIERDSAARYPTPAQLPADVAGFIGRAGALLQLSSLRERGDRAAFAVVTGMAGVGKTSLAVHWAHRVRKDFPDGQLFVNLRGFDPRGSALSPAEAVRGLLDTLGVTPPRIPAEFHAQTSVYRSLLADRRVLIVLDNARDADQVRPLLPGSSGCMVVVTSRDPLTGLVAIEGAHPLVLNLMTTEEARGLLVHRLGACRSAAEPEAVDRIAASCDRLPLALVIVAARAATRPQLPLAAVVDELSETDRGIDAFDGGEPAPTYGRCFPGRMTPSASRRPGCSGYSDGTPGRTSRCRRRRVWQALHPR
jgi:transcriptional regulator with XRE-family HTH domain